MNRKERRAAQGRSPSGAPVAGASPNDAVMALFRRALQQQGVGELAGAALLYKKVLAQRPDYVAARDRLAMVYLAQGKLDKAAAQYAELARIAPQTLAQLTTVVDTLKKLMPALAAALADPSAAAPDIAAANSPVEGGITSITANPYFRLVLESAMLSDVALERWLTSMRASVLRATLADSPAVNEDVLAFCSALAQQCFINEYVFAVTPGEQEQLERLKAIVGEALSSDASIRPLRLIAVAMYQALSELPGADAIAKRAWPPSAIAVVAQQVSEPREEQRLRCTIPQLTQISDGVTAQVRQQYEENPYPRWASLASPPSPLLELDDYVRVLFPTASFRPTGRPDTLDILVAGCGTGRHVLELAQSYRGARVLGVDLSLASLASAKRRTPTRLSGAVEFAQADILALGSIERRFDLINVGGVLHHMPEPMAGWRELIKLMKPNGLMQVGLYSAYARRDVIAARKMIAERGYRPTPDDIRRCRQDLLKGPDKLDVAKFTDFFTVSACRDLLFHVHELQMTIPQIKAFLAENDLKFLGFDFGAPEGQEHYRNLFARSGWSTGDLDRWDAFEQANPAVFAGMYIFWVQKV